MKDLTFGTLIAVFEEIFGPWLFWVMAVVALLVGLAFIYVVIRDRGLESRPFLRAELSAPIGAVAAVAFVFFMTKSGLRDMGGPIDVIVMLAIAAAGAVGLTILVYVVQEMFLNKKTGE
ncbi:DUF5368 domain-containing protein [Rhodovulum sp. YNF3179]|uniref:DUF5368 domain-containing protein n=1 Tax=Rhodovulum sp. YNF3179 TaxID=3425127 RepID=UPI003D34ED03